MAYYKSYIQKRYNIAMYSVIIATRTNFRDSGMCYDFFSCESHTNTLNKLKEYHDKMCEGKHYRECNNCNFHDEIDKIYSPCRIFCDKCKINNGCNNQTKYKECQNCDYCNYCDNCTIYKCKKECFLQCYFCGFNDNTLYTDTWINNSKCCKNFKKCDCSSTKKNNPFENEIAIRIRIYLLNCEIDSWKNFV